MFHVNNIHQFNKVLVASWLRCLVRGRRRAFQLPGEAIVALVEAVAAGRVRLRNAFFAAAIVSCPREVNGSALFLRKLPLSMPSNLRLASLWAWDRGPFFLFEHSGQEIVWNYIEVAGNKNRGRLEFFCIRRSFRSHAAKDDEAMQLPASFKWFVVMWITIGTSQRERGRSGILKIDLTNGCFLACGVSSEVRYVIRTYENEIDEHDSASIWCDDTSTHIHCRIFIVPISWQIWGLKLWRAFKRRVGTTTNSALGGVWHHTKSDETDAEIEVELERVGLDLFSFLVYLYSIYDVFMYFL